MLKQAEGELKCNRQQVLMTMGAYVIAIFMALMIIALMDEGAFSSIATVSVLFEGLSFVFLTAHCLSKGDRHGISAKSLILNALSVACVLINTVWLHGYLPVDSSGDFVHQSLSMITLLMLAFLINRIVIRKSLKHQEDKVDTMPIVAMTVACFVLAALVHADMNRMPVFDTLWMAGTLLKTAAVLPQLWVVSKNGGRIDACMSHSLAAMCVSRIMSCSFFWRVYDGIMHTPWIEGFNHSSFVICGSHLLHLLLMCDFGFLYLRALSKGRVSGEMHFQEFDV